MEADDEGERETVVTPPPAKKPTTMPPPYIVGEGLPVEPPKLVVKIQKGNSLTWLSSSRTT